MSTVSSATMIASMDAPDVTLYMASLASASTQLPSGVQSIPPGEARTVLADLGSQTDLGSLATPGVRAITTCTFSGIPAGIGIAILSKITDAGRVGVGWVPDKLGTSTSVTLPCFGTYIYVVVSNPTDVTILFPNVLTLTVDASSPGLRTIERDLLDPGAVVEQPGPAGANTYIPIYAAENRYMRVFRDVNAIVSIKHSTYMDAHLSLSYRLSSIPHSADTSGGGLYLGGIELPKMFSLEEWGIPWQGNPETTCALEFLVQPDLPGGYTYLGPEATNMWINYYGASILGTPYDIPIATGSEPWIPASPSGAYCTPLLGLLASGAHIPGVGEEPTTSVAYRSIGGTEAGYTTDLERGTFTLCTSPGTSGEITCDAKGALYTQSGSPSRYVDTAADITQCILHNYTTRYVNTTSFGTRLTIPFPLSKLDSASFDAVNYEVPEPMGLYIPDRTNVLSAIDLLCSSYTGIYGYNADQLFFIRMVYLPSPINTNSEGKHLGEYEVLENMKIIKAQQPQWRSSVLYNKNYTVQNAGTLATSVDVERVDYLTGDGDTTLASSTGARSLHVDAIDSKLGVTLFSELEGGQREVARRLRLYSTQLYQASLSVLSGGDRLARVGDIITITDDTVQRIFNIPYATGIVSDIRTDFLTGKLELSVLFKNPLEVCPEYASPAWNIVDFVTISGAAAPVANTNNTTVSFGCVGDE